MILLICGIVAVIFSIVSLLIYAKFRHRIKLVKKFPGPKGLPLIGVGWDLFNIKTSG